MRSEARKRSEKARRLRRLREGTLPFNPLTREIMEHVSCKRKTRYETQQDAEGMPKDKNLVTYLCRFCGGYHRTHLLGV
jgi:hypothetical protein